MDPDYPAPPPFDVPEDRSLVTSGEPPQVGDDCVPGHNDREWIGYGDQGGGHVPEDYDWVSNPKQYQDDNSAK
jgi:hypothetical protein